MELEAIIFGKEEAARRYIERKWDALTPVEKRALKYTVDLFRSADHIESRMDQRFWGGRFSAEEFGELTRADMDKCGERPDALYPRLDDFGDFWRAYQQLSAKSKDELAQIREYVPSLGNFLVVL